MQKRREEAGKRRLLKELILSAPSTEALSDIERCRRVIQLLTLREFWEELIRSHTQPAMAKRLILQPFSGHSNQALPPIDRYGRIALVPSFIFTPILLYIYPHPEEIGAFLERDFTLVAKNKPATTQWCGIHACLPPGIFAKMNRSSHGPSWFASRALACHGILTVVPLVWGRPFASVILYRHHHWQVENLQPYALCTASVPDGTCHITFGRKPTIVVSSIGGDIRHPVIK